jgi:hypothetical protein
LTDIVCHGSGADCNTILTKVRLCHGSGRYLLAYPLEVQVQAQHNSHETFLLIYILHGAEPFLKSKPAHETFSGKNGTGTLFHPLQFSHQYDSNNAQWSYFIHLSSTFDSIIKENTSHFFSKAMHTKSIKEVM